MSNTILITAGPTREWIDPIRFVSNESTGLVGYHLAKEAKRRKYRVILILGPTNLPKLSGVTTVHVNTAEEMLKELEYHIAEADALIMSSAVADFRPKTASASKLKRKGNLVVEFEPNPDLLKTLSDKKLKEDRVFVGFCLETEKVRERALEKLKNKNLDYIVALQHDPEKLPFGERPFSPTIFGADGSEVVLEDVQKEYFSKVLMNTIGKEFLS